MKFTVSFLLFRLLLSWMNFIFWTKSVFNELNCFIDHSFIYIWHPCCHPHIFFFLVSFTSIALITCICSMILLYYYYYFSMITVTLTWAERKRARMSMMLMYTWIKIQQTLSNSSTTSFSSSSYQGSKIWMNAASSRILICKILNKKILNENYLSFNPSLSICWDICKKRIKASLCWHNITFFEQSIFLFHFLLFLSL